jgi:hypothetical protein
VRHGRRSDCDLPLVLGCIRDLPLPPLVKQCVWEGAMKKPVKRVNLLEVVLSDLLKVEDMLLQLELKNALQTLSAKQKHLHKQVMERLRELIRDLTTDVAQEHRVS